MGGSVRGYHPGTYDVAILADQERRVMPLTVPRSRIPNPILPVLRMQWQYSQQDLADRLTEEAVKQGDNQTVCDVRMIRRWENGDVIWPQEKYRILLENVFGKSASGLGFVRKWTRSSAGWTLVSTATDHKVNAGETVRAAERMFFGVGPVTVALPLRKGVIERERVLIAAEDSATVDQLESVLAGQALTSVRTTVTPDATEPPSGDAIVVCGPKIAYFARHLIDGQTVLHIAGIHAVGSLGMVHYLTRNLTKLSSTFGDESFSLAATSDYNGLTITGSTLFLGPYRW